MATRLTTIEIVAQLKSELDCLLDDEADLVKDFAEGRMAPARLDVVETDSTVCVFVEVPGIQPEDLDVTISGSHLTVSGEKLATGRPAKSDSFLCIERRWGRIERSVELPVTVNPRQGRAVLERGVLRIEFPVLTDQRNQPFRLPVEKSEGEELE